MPDKKMRRLVINRRIAALEESLLNEVADTEQLEQELRSLRFTLTNKFARKW
jgi:hypothetical protein